MQILCVPSSDFSKILLLESEPSKAGGARPFRSLPSASRRGLFVAKTNVTVSYTELPSGWRDASHCARDARAPELQLWIATAKGLLRWRASPKTPPRFAVRCVSGASAHRFKCEGVEQPGSQAPLSFLQVLRVRHRAKDDPPLALRAGQSGCKKPGCAPVSP